MLRLNGVGVRSKLGIQVYMAALYLARPTAVGSEAIQEDLPKRLVQLFVFRQVSRQAVVDHLRQAFARQHLSDRVQDDIETFLSVVEDVEAGDRMVYDYVPGRGTSILIDGKRKALVAGQPFMEALFGVFIGADPPTRKLKRGLLGDTAP